MRRGGPVRAMQIGAELQPDGGVHFRIWAPLPKSIVLVVDGVEHAMQTEEDGYHSTYVAAARAGSRYGYRVDDGERILPDPGSRAQPEGPHGPSAVVDPSTYCWTDLAWPGVRREGQVIYEMHVGTFTREGTWTAAIDKLPLLKEIGIGAYIEVVRPAGGLSSARIRCEAPHQNFAGRLARAQHRIVGISCHKQ